MSRVVISKKGSLIFYIENYKSGSSGYIIDYTKGDLSKNISCQCKIKVVEYMIFGTNENSKKYFINLKHKYPYKTYKSFVVHNSEINIVVCVKRISDWEFDSYYLTKNKSTFREAGTNPFYTFLIFNNETALKEAFDKAVAHHSWQETPQLTIKYLKESYYESSTISKLIRYTRTNSKTS